MCLFQKLTPEYQDYLIYDFDSVRTEKAFVLLNANYYLKDLTLDELHSLFMILFPNDKFDVNKLYEVFETEKIY